ncbi:hypothetical protein DONNERLITTCHEN_00140 [Janthinobacterium phage vB_JliS-Donnerlittchen]|uniref:DUF1833 domain-containing protein n=1 Tax=Janthinobacterium phage vB_JliS-Donnerlittchen TaxID=2948610 RepID=A0A9E7MPZ8_9CAUD|nr:hypothetical protein P9A49_gp15 [Janthinobacterium phage vB_JliM-Donnerlittchen]USN14415.1 hypothetical protein DONNERLITTCHEN_00140 [Janthinobacterium phage vB_JliM-Donnerlittchen]
MNSALSEALKEAYATAPAGKAIVETLELRLQGSDSIFIYRGVEPLQMRLETGEWVEFEPVPFQFRLPKSSETGSQSLDIQVDNVDARISDFITAARGSLSPVQVIYRPYLSDDLTGPQMDPPLVLYMKGATITATTASAQASFIDIVNKRFPNDYYTGDRFPGLR